MNKTLNNFQNHLILIKLSNLIFIFLIIISKLLINLLKKIVFDKDQLITFELLSKLENCFYNISNEPKTSTNEIIQSLQSIISNKQNNIFNLKKFLIRENESRENEYLQNDYYSSNVI